MICADETFDGTWPFMAQYTQAAGFRQHYIDEGPAEAPHTVVMLHGEPTWGYLWRNLIVPLSKRHRVIVPDHMGFGKSATPRDRTYLASDHINNLEKLLVDILDLRGITLVLHDWGGPIGIGFALRHPERVARIFATNTVLPLGIPGYDELFAANMKDSSWFQWARAACANGTFEQIVGNAGHTIIHLMFALQTITRPENATPSWIRAYTASFPTRDECQGVIRFPQQLVTAESDPGLENPTSEAVAAVRAKPAILVEGMQDTALVPRHIIPAFKLAYPDAPIIELPDAGHFTPEDSPETLRALLELFVQTM